MNQENRPIVEPSDQNTHKLAEGDLAATIVSPAGAAAAPLDSVDPMIGYLLDGRYELLQAIGSGGMSVVYKARLNNVNKLVAVKTLNIQVLAKDSVRERFHREIDLLLKLEHPHIVAVQDCLYGPNCQPYLVMDLLRGVTLEQELEKCGFMPADRVRKIMIQVCAAVKYAHQHAVVHRDLKPGNIMLLENEVDFVKVLDFGLALIGENTRKITQSGEFWGSPPYASPEQVQSKTTDHRSDIYSLGCVMYELLSGKDPFHGAGLFELLHKHVNEQPEPLLVANPAIAVPAEMERIVFKCLEKKPQDRFQSIAELQAALEIMNSGSNTVHSSSDHNKAINRLRSDQPFSLEAPPVEAAGYRKLLVTFAILVVLVFSVFGLTKAVRTSKPEVSTKTPASNIPAIKDSRPAVSATKATSTPSNEEPVVTSRSKKLPLNGINHIRRRESTSRNSPVVRSHPAGTAGGAKPVLKPVTSSKSDPFSRLRDHLSTGARSE